MPKFRFSGKVFLRPHFQVCELRCADFCGRGMYPGDLDPRLLDGLEELRALLGVPVSVTSGVRCVRQNERVYHSIGEIVNRGSQHVRGRAADIVVPGVAASEVQAAAEEVDVFWRGGIGRYETFTHVDCYDLGGRRRW